jgi:hypothetical protein
LIARAQQIVNATAPRIFQRGIFDDCGDEHDSGLRQRIDATNALIRRYRSLKSKA